MKKEVDFSRWNVMAIECRLKCYLQNNIIIQSYKFNDLCQVDLANQSVEV